MSTQSLHDRLLVRRIPEQGPVSGEIVNPGTAKRKPWKGEVLVVGQGKDPAACRGQAFDVGQNGGARVIGKRRHGSVFPEHSVGPGENLFGPALGQ